MSSAFKKFKIKKHCDTPKDKKEILYYRGRKGQHFHVEYVDKNSERRWGMFQLNHRFTLPDDFGRCMAFVGHVYKPTDRHLCTSISIALKNIKVLRRVTRAEYNKHFDRYPFLQPPENVIRNLFVTEDHIDTEVFTDSESEPEGDLLP